MRVQHRRIRFTGVGEPLNNSAAALSCIGLPRPIKQTMGYLGVTCEKGT